MKYKSTFNKKIPSLIELGESLEVWFKKNYSIEPVVITSGRTKPIKLPSENIHLVVLADSICNYVNSLQLGEIPKHYLWVLCDSMRELLAKVFGISAQQIGVLPRYELFPLLRKPYSLEESKYFLYPGRLIGEKNLLLIISLYRKIQKNKNFENHRLLIYSPQKSKDVSNKIKTILRKNPDVNVFWNSDKLWTQRIPPQPAGIILSSYRLEEFGVSVARLQQIGSPLILSHWFAHKDIAGENVQFVETEELSQLKLKNHKTFFVRKKRNTIKPFCKPKILDQGDLNKLKSTLPKTSTAQLLVKMFFSDETADIDQPAFKKIYDILT
jgi:hypothetical protein